MADEMEKLVSEVLEADEEGWYEPAGTLARLGHAALERTLALTEDPLPQIRIRACYVLGQVSDPTQETWTQLKEGIPTLLQLLQSDPDHYVRAAAANALGHQHEGAEESIPGLCALAHHADAEIRFDATWALDSFGEWAWETRPELAAPAREVLLALAMDEDEEVRDWAVFGLYQGDHDTPEVRACFWASLDDPNPDVRGEAVSGVAKFGDRTVIPRLERLLREDEWLSPLYFVAAAEFSDVSLLPAVEEAEKRWYETAEEDEPANSTVEMAVKELRESARSVDTQQQE
jgi:HEAT repeat protein